MSLQNLVNDYNKVKNEFQQKAQSLMKAEFKDFFDRNSEIESIVWTQYTDFFNDGDPCEFGVRDFYYVPRENLQGENFDNSYYSLEDWQIFDEPRWWQASVAIEQSNAVREIIGNQRCDEIQQDFDKFRKMLNNVPDDVFLGMFGDHALITATRDGFDIEEFDHE